MLLAIAGAKKSTKHVPDLGTYLESPGVKSGAWAYRFANGWEKSLVGLRKGHIGPGPASTAPSVDRNRDLEFFS